MAQMTKTETVLHKGSALPNWYTSHETGSVLIDPDPELRDHVLKMDKDVWEEMGRPDSITVTIRPGDHLNA